MPYEVAPLPFKPPRLNGLSERLLASHYENNYGGAVRRLNAIESDLARLDWSAAATFVINGLKREELIAANSMILHEAYFDSLGGSGDAGGDLAAALERDFGSMARWRQEFTAMGKALGGGSGWVLLTLSERDGRLRNVWAADHAHTPGRRPGGALSHQRWWPVGRDGNLAGCRRSRMPVTTSRPRLSSMRSGCICGSL